MNTTFCVAIAKSGVKYCLAPEHYEDFRHWMQTDQIDRIGWMGFVQAEGPPEKMLLNVAEIECVFLSTPEARAMYEEWHNVVHPDRDKPEWER